MTSPIITGADPGEWLVAGHRLTAAHRAFLLLLPANGDWLNTDSRIFDQYGKNAFRGFGKSGLIEGQYRELMRHRLTDEGQRVCDVLRARAAQ